MSDNYKEAEELRNRMRMGTGVNGLLKADQAPTHHMDSLQQFKKDFATHERQQRDRQLTKRQAEMERKRLQYLQRQNKRWQKVQNDFTKVKERQYTKAYSQMMGVKKTHNTNGLAYNPINLSYDNNTEGEKLKIRDEDREVRRFVRAKNMDERGHGKYNVINGISRKGIDEVIPQSLTDRYSEKLYNHYDGLKLKVPSEEASSPYSKYY